MISNGNRTERSPIRSVIIRVITKSDDRAAGVRFVYQEYDYRPNRPFAATSSRDVIFIKLWAITLRMPEMENAYRKYHNGQV